jgi:hypothetical protein
LTVYNLPGGSEIYGGADLMSFRSDDNTVFIVYCGERTGHKFGTHIVRCFTPNRAEYIDLPSFFEGRAGCAVEPDGLYVSWPSADAKALVRYKVPGYVTPGYPSNGQQVAPLPPAPSQPASTVDATARQQISELRAQMEREVKALRNEIDVLKRRPVMTEQAVKDYVWTWSNRRIFWDLTADTQGALANTIRAMIKQK